MAKISDVFDLQMGKTPARANAEYWMDGANKWVSIADLSGYEKYVEDTKEKITDLAVTESGIKAVPSHTVIMSFKLSLGKVAITKTPVYTNEAIMAFLPKHGKSILPDYFYHYFSSIDWSKGTNRAVMGATLNKATLGEMEIQIPSMVKQVEIADRLNKIDELISLRKRQLTKLDELVKARFVELFGDPETNPNGWEQVTVGDVCSSIVRGPFGSALKKEFFVEPSSSTYKVYEQKHAIQKSATIGTYYITEEKYQELKRFECLSGDILMSCSGTMGELYQLPEECERGIINQALCKFTLNDKMLPICFLTYMRQTIGNLETKGSGIKNIAAVSYVKAMPINLPPMSVQIEFEHFCKQTDKSKLTVQQSLDKLELLKKALMQKYFG